MPLGVRGGVRRSSGGREEATTSPASWVPLSGAIDFAWCCEFLGCHLDFSRASSPTQDPVGLGWAERKGSPDSLRLLGMRLRVCPVSENQVKKRVPDPSAVTAKKKSSTTDLGLW